MIPITTLHIASDAGKIYGRRVRLAERLMLAQGTSTLDVALGEAAWITGLERIRRPWSIMRRSVCPLVPRRRTAISGVPLT